MRAGRRSRLPGLAAGVCLRMFGRQPGPNKQRGSLRCRNPYRARPFGSEPAMLRRAEQRRDIVRFVGRGTRMCSVPISFGPSESASRSARSSTLVARGVRGIWPGAIACAKVGNAHVRHFQVRDGARSLAGVDGQSRSVRPTRDQGLPKGTGLKPVVSDSSPRARLERKLREAARRGRRLGGCHSGSSPPPSQTSIAIEPTNGKPSTRKGLRRRSVR
jgi:hypothetical protein